MDDRPRSLFNELDLDWCRFARSGSARRSLQRWRRLEPVLTSYDSVEALLAGHVERLLDGQDAELIAVIVDDADFADADPLVDAQVFSYGSLLSERRSWM